MSNNCLQTDLLHEQIVTGSRLSGHSCGCARFRFALSEFVRDLQDLCAKACQTCAKRGPWIGKFPQCHACRVRRAPHHHTGQPGLRAHT